MESLVRKLQQNDIGIDVVDGRISLQIPQGFEAQAIIQEIKANKQALIDFISRQKGQGGYAAIAPAPEQDHYPLSSAQQRLYFLQELDREGWALNMPQTHHFPFLLDPEQVAAAFRQLIQRHESLRSSFEMVEGEPRQRIHESVPFDIRYEKRETAEEVEAFKASFFRPFLLAEAPLLRVGLIHYTPTQGTGSPESILLVDMHHIISDRLSNGILMKDILQIYEGKILPELRLQYKDFVHWQQATLEETRDSTDKQFWLGQFAEEVSPLVLPTDFSRPLMKGNEGQKVLFSIGKEETQQLQQIAKAQGSTMFVVLLSVLKVFLYKLSQQKDLVVGTLTSGRFHPDLEEIIGMFVNTVPLRSQLDPTDSFLTFLQSLTAQTHTCFEHQGYPYEALVDELFTTRDPSRTPLFDVMFSYFNSEADTDDLPDAEEVAFSEKHQRSLVDLYVSAVAAQNYLSFEIDFSTDLYTEETIRRFVAYFKQLIQQITAAPAQALHTYSLLTEADTQQILYQFNDTEYVPESADSFIELFAQQVAQTPAQTAVVHNESTLTYQELAARSTALAAYLQQEAQIGKGDRLVLYLPRSIDTLVCILAAFQAGAAYVPVDIHFPLQRVGEILTDCEPQVLFTTNALAAELSSLPESSLKGVQVIAMDDFQPGDHSLQAPTIAAEDLAYIIYTSGSTGKPKGVMIHQSGMLNHLYAKVEDLGMTAQTVLAQTASVSFDISVWQFLSALLTGGQVHILDKEKLFTTESLLAELNEGKITIFESVPSLMTSFLAGLSLLDAYGLDHLEWMLATGEPLTLHLAQQWYDHFPEIKLLNAYGPTEASDDVTHHVVDRDPHAQLVPVGKPILNTHIYILDEYLNLCPVGVTGEICVSGIGVGLGYRNNEEKTRAAFCLNPLAGHFQDPEHKKLYKTGDLGYFQADGTVVCLGRKDHQVKILGNRIELGEIADRLRQHEAIQEAVVLAKGQNAEAHLVAYYVAAQPVEIKDLRAFLLAHLPEYMVPHYFGHLTHLPVTTSGKLDQKALPDPQVDANQSYLAPETEIEQTLVEIWAEVLHLPAAEISVARNFFELGGHSLKAIFMINKIMERLAVQVPLRTVFVSQDIRSLAQVIEGLNSMESAGVVHELKTAAPRDFYPLSSAQLRIYLNQKMMLGSHITHMYSEYPLAKTFDKDAVQAIFQQLINRHESLRTSFQMEDNVPVQVIHETVPFELIRISEAEWNDPDFAYDRTIDLSQAPLFKVGWVEGLDANLMIVDMHHIISDGISDAILYQEFMKLAQGEELAPLSLQYKDFAVWQHEKRTSGSLQAQESYWRTIFEGDLPKLNLPGDRLDLDPLSQKGDALTFHLGTELTAELKTWAQQQTVPLFSVLIALQAMVLHKLADQEDIIIGVTSAGRNHPALEHIIGIFLNTFAVRLAPTPAKTLAAFVEETADHLTEALDNQDYQFDELVEHLKLPRDSWRNPLFNVIMVMQNYLDEASLNLEISPDQALVSVQKGIYIINDWFFTFTETGDNLLVNVQYNSGLYTQVFAERLFSLVKEMALHLCQHAEQTIRQIQLTHTLQEAEVVTVDDGFDF